MWKRLLHRLRLARELSFSGWLSLLEAWWALAVFYVRLRWMSYERLGQSSHLGLKEDGEQLLLARQLYRLVGWAAHLHLFPMACLVQSLALRWMLSRRGISSQVRIGAKKTMDGISAHAWVEINGQAVGGQEAGFEGFRPFDSVEHTLP